MTIRITFQVLDEFNESLPGQQVVDCTLAGRLDRGVLASEVLCT